MKRYGYLLTLILTLICGNVYAHQDFWITQNYGNVKVRIKTGYKYEEIYKVFLFGQLAEQFAKQLNYSGNIFLDFSHYYTGEVNPDYFISYDKGNGGYNHKEKGKDLLKKKSIVIRQVARQFDAQTTLKLLEYAILNIEYIKTSQTEIEYKKNYRWWTINSIDTNVIKKLLNEPNSTQLNNALNFKFERMVDNKWGISYYLHNNKYTFFSREWKQTDNKWGQKDTDLITLDNIYDLKIFNNYSAIVFDTDSSFYFMRNGFCKQVSDKHVIQNMHGFYEPYSVNYIGGDKLSIFYRYNSKPEFDAELNDTIRRFNVPRTSIYLYDKDILIQDLDELINDKLNHQNE